MKKLNILVSLTTDENDYQIEQAAAAHEAAHALDVNVQIIYAGNDAITQSQQLLKAIQAHDSRPDAIMFEPVSGTGLPQVAREACAAGIGWVVLNRDVGYISELRKAYRVPIFGVSSDHDEIGRIQGRQFAHLLPKGGSVLYVEGPSNSAAAQQRTAGMQETKPWNVQVSTLRAQWTEASAQQAVASWLRLSTSQRAHIDLVGAQDDSMAMGARKAFEQQINRDKWNSLKFTGCDGLPKTGQSWVRSGLLAATVIVPPNTKLALEMLVKSIRTGTPLQERGLTMPISYPPVPS